MHVHLLEVENKNSQPNNCGKAIILSLGQISHQGIWLKF